MKPDQHKLKKNAAYKKKHGIQGEKNVPVKNDSVQNTSKNIEMGPGSRLSWPKQTSASYSSSDESADEKVKISFARRKIESNWQKYEIDIGASEDTLRGADYNELLQSTRNVLPQYQFGTFHPLHGVEEEDQNPAASDSDWLEKFVALDCEHLAAAFLCVPLQRRLDIDDSMFEDSSLEMFNNDASLHLCAYREKFGNSDSKSSHDVLGDEAFSLQRDPSVFENHERLLNSVEKAHFEVQTDHLSVNKTDPKELDVDPLIHVVDMNTVLENCVEVDRLMPHIPFSVTAASSNEAAHTNSDLNLSKATCTSSKEKTIEELELELDSLLSI